MKDQQIEKTVEVLCEKGCQSVRDDIEKLENNQQLSETAGLSQQQIGKVLDELKSIMSVYGDSCSIDDAIDIEQLVISNMIESNTRS